MENVMEKPVNISNDKKNVLEFDIELTGVDETDMEVRFIIEGKGMDLGFDSKKISTNTWSVEIPAMKILETAQYPYYISVIVDGYAFRGITGSVNILSAENIKASAPVNTTIAPGVVKKAAKTKETVPTTKSTIKPKRPLSKPAPLNVKKTEELLDELIPKKVAKEKSGLDSSIIKTIEKAKGEVKKKVAANKKDTKEKKEVLDVDINKIVDKAKADVKKKAEVKKESIEVPTEVLVEAPVAAPKEAFSAKKVASDLIKSVTGMGNRVVESAGSPNSPVAKKKRRGDKVKEILAAESKEETKPQQKQEATGRKIIRGGSIKEVDSSKEDKIKDALKEDAEKRTVTTTPVNKTVH